MSVQRHSPVAVQNDWPIVKSCRRMGRLAPADDPGRGGLPALDPPFDQLADRRPLLRRANLELQVEILADVRRQPDIAGGNLPALRLRGGLGAAFRELPHGRGTEVRVELKYDPPAGKLGTAVAKLVGQSKGRRATRTDGVRLHRPVLACGNGLTPRDQRAAQPRSAPAVAGLRVVITTPKSTMRASVPLGS